MSKRKIFIELNADHDHFRKQLMDSEIILLPPNTKITVVDGDVEIIETEKEIHLNIRESKKSNVKGTK